MRAVSAKAIFVVSLVGLLVFGAFTYGVLVGGYEWWPFEEIQTARSHVTTFLETGELAPAGRSVEAPDGAPRTAFEVYDAGRVDAGLYALMGFDGTRGDYAVWLYDHRGARLHTWPLDYMALDPDGPSNLSDSPHGMEVLPDGSVVVGFDKGDVMARLDACANPVWVRPGVFHHAIERDENGDLWAWRGEGTAYSDRQYLVRFDADTGEVLEEIDFLRDVVMAQGEKSFVFAVRPDYPFREFDRDPPPERDLFHPNDVEVLPAALADRYPSFSAGDLLISLRNIDLVAVIDRRSKRVKWWSRGPWMLQHDPDFTADGTISVFDNNSERGRSEILTIDPATMEVRNRLYDGNLEFFTHAMGKHSYLPNGNLLIVVPGEGRVVEVSPTGDKVLEFNNVINESFNGHVENGVWLPADYFAEIPACGAEGAGRSES